jgi:hypothetical protein
LEKSVYLFMLGLIVCLLRIKPPDGAVIDAKKRPFVVVDPRAGHGPGIGGFKADSEIGVAMLAGHSCYFIGFTPDPLPGQTIEDVMRAEEVFLETVIELYPEAEGKPCVIGNCQAGWAVMMLAAVRPELFGSIIVPGAPLSYWAGVKEESAMRQVAELAEQVREQRMQSVLDNPFMKLQEMVSSLMISALAGWRDLRDQSLEQISRTVYGNPMLRAPVGLKA